MQPISRQETQRINTIIRVNQEPVPATGLLVIFMLAISVFFVVEFKHLAFIAMVVTFFTVGSITMLTRSFKCR